MRETSVWSWRQRSLVVRATGDTTGAEHADQRAAAHRARFAGAAG